MLDLVQEIAQADKGEIGQILNAVLQRYDELFPDWQLSTISLQKSADRNDQLDRMIELLQKLKTSTAESE